MTVPRIGVPPGTRQNDEVELRVPPMPEQLPVVRTVAASLAISAEFDVDRIEDLRLLADELCSTLMRHANGHGLLVCRFRSDENGLRLLATAPVVHGRVDQSSFSWRMLDALADSLRGWTSMSGDDEYAHIEVIKRREAPADAENSTSDAWR